MKFFDRDLSWLSFNYRVLLEAMDDSVPLIERLRFIAIYSSNLDEFFRVRVADIRNIIQIDKKKIYKKIEFDPQQTLSKIYEEVNTQLVQYGTAFKGILESLKEKNITICTSLEEIPISLNDELLHYFKTQIAAYLKPINLEETEDLFIDNQSIYLAMQFKSGSQKILNIPSEKIGRFYRSKTDNGLIYVFIDDIIRMHFDIIFPSEEVVKCGSIKLNKNADLNLRDEYHGNLAKKIEKQIQKRNLGVPSRFLYDTNIGSGLLKTLSEKLHLTEDDLSVGGRYHNMNDLFQISGNDSQLEYDILPAISKPKVEKSRSLFQLIKKQDQIFHFPYHSYDYILQFFNEAAIDSDVEEINVTFYRMAKDSIIGEALISAAANGKKVSVFMELKARFDEANNLQWAKRMQAAGINIVYSLPGLKVHAKVALVKKKNINYGFFGTGNLNERTSEIYCDHGLLTCHKEMTSELSNVFEYLLTKYSPPKFNHLIVSQFGALEDFKSKIDQEIRNAEAGKEARIVIKLNNLQEQELISKLYEAAKKGVDVKLIVRSICCLVPNKNLQVKRIVDRYLEHARVFYFHNDGGQEIYLGSSDWMNRNLHSRIEVSFPVYDETIKQEILSILKFQWEDDTKGVFLSPKMENLKPEMKNKVRAQVATYEYLLNMDKVN